MTSTIEAGRRRIHRGGDITVLRHGEVPRSAWVRDTPRLPDRRPTKDERRLRQKVQRVAPPGSIVATAVAVRAVIRYTDHGGGPADGALKSAVSAVPLSSTRHGHPSSAQRRAMPATVCGSVTLAAFPSTTRA